MKNQRAGEIWNPKADTLFWCACLLLSDNRLQRKNVKKPELQWIFGGKDAIV